MKIAPMTGAIPVNDGARPIAQSLRFNTNATPAQYRPDGQQALAQNPGPVNNESGTASAIEDTKPISPQFAQLQRQKRAMAAQAKALADQQKALEAKLQGGNFISKDQLKPGNALKVLLENGVTYEQLRDEILANQTSPEIYELKNKVGTLEQSVEDRIQKFMSERDQAEQAYVLQEAEGLAAEGEDFALIRLFGHTKSVPALIAAWKQDRGQTLSTRQAMQMMEETLSEEASRITALEKVRSKFQQPAQPVERQSGIRTLTNKDTASIPLTAKERALAAFYGTLKR